MTLRTTPPITLLQIKTEFGNSGTHLKAFYSGGGIVAANTQNGAGFLIPTSGTLNISDFYGANSANLTTSLFAQSGPFTETVPAGASTVDIYVWGAGGGGGFMNIIAARGGAGGGGGFSSSLGVSVAGAQTFIINVGTGGTGSGTGGGNGVSGTQSNVVHTGITTMIGFGGGFGNGGTSSSASISGGAAGGASGGTTTNLSGTAGAGGTGGVGLTGNSAGGIAHAGVGGIITSFGGNWGLNNGSQFPGVGGGGGDGHGNGGVTSIAGHGSDGAVYFVYHR